MGSAQLMSVVEWWSDGTNFCRLWSNRWCEQGGIVFRSGSSQSEDVTVTPHRSFRSTNYVVVATNQNGKARDYHNLGGITVHDKTKSSFILSFYGYNSDDVIKDFCWKADGFC